MSQKLKIAFYWAASCGGATPNQQVGTSMITALASIPDLGKEQGHNTDEDVEKLISQINDPVGTFYMYGLTSSILKRKVMKK